MSDRLAEIEKSDVEAWDEHDTLFYVGWLIAEVHRLRGELSDYQTRYEQLVRMYGCPCSKCHDEIIRIYHEVMDGNDN